MDSTETSLLNIEWRIKNATKDHLTNGKSVSSNNFEIFIDNKLTKWYLSAHIRDLKLGVYLYLCPQHPKITGYVTEFDFFIRTITNKKDKVRHAVHEFNSFEKGYGYSSLISIAKLFDNSAKYLKNGTLIVGTKIKIIKRSIEVPNKILVPTNSRHQAIFRDYFNTKTLSDLTFICSDMIKVPAHRFAIAASSPVWMKMIEFVPDVKKIKIDDIDSATMTEILRFIYTEKVNDIENMASKLIYGAQKYELNDLKEFCVASMINNLSIKNAVDCFLLADQHDYKDLLESCINFIKINHHVMVGDESWNKLDKNHLNILLGYYQQNPEYILILESSWF